MTQETEFLHKLRRLEKEEFIPVEEIRDMFRRLGEIRFTPGRALLVKEWQIAVVEIYKLFPKAF
jgi:hypothetical protein